jgi:hypothetical protein
VFCHPTGALPVRVEIVVLPANAYDSSIAGTDTIQADVTQWNGTAVTTPATAGSPVVTLADSAITAAKFAADAITAAKLAADVTTELQSGLATAASLATLDGKADSILADTNELQTDWANGGRLDLILDARASQASVDDLPTNAELATSQAAADDATLTAIAAVDAKIDIIDTNVDQIETLLGETDTDVAAIKAKTDSLTFTEAGVVDANANVNAINGTAVTGDGALTPWGPA